MTTTEIVLTLASGVAAAVAIVLTPATRSLVEGPKYGLWPAALLIAFTALSGLSVVWSVQPDASWQDAGRLLAYSGVFGASVALVRLAPERWPAILGRRDAGGDDRVRLRAGDKGVPGQSSAPAVTYARLEEPYGYWNAIGLTAAMGAIGCLWLGARRAGHALLSALAYPAMGIMGVTLMLAYSRGAARGARRRGGSVAVHRAAAPARRERADSGRRSAPRRSWAGTSRDTRSPPTTFPWLSAPPPDTSWVCCCSVMVLALALAGIAIGFLSGRRPPSRATRTRAGAILLAVIALALLGMAGALAHSHRGFTGSISHTLDTLTEPQCQSASELPRPADGGGERARALLERRR